QDSPLSKGSLQFDLWNFKVSNDRYDWDALRRRIIRRGVANAQLILLTDTSSLSRLTPFTEGFEPLASTVLVKGTASSSYVSLNARLVQDLQNLGLWNEDIRKELLETCGSVQSISQVPENLKDIFKTVWEVDEDAILRHAVMRAPFICQSQSITLYRENPSRAWLSDNIFAAWKDGLKTGLYRLRGRHSRASESSPDEDVTMT
ncbi:hypothetical protein CVT26_011295, partial [Gymnopilus dilepis]